MIGYLQGKIKSIDKGKCIIICGGVGYRVELGSLAENLTEGDNISLYIHTHQRENELSLFGFSGKSDLDMFETLIDISGIGPKGALQLVSDIGVSQIIRAVVDRDVSCLKVPGIGKKTAEKIILELRDKVEKGSIVIEQGKGTSKTTQKLREVVGALKALGYNIRQAEGVLTELKRENDWEDKTVQELVKLSLNKINK
ncbi:MAG: Holliday junction branch migration protein RuvA [Candidatus Dojkabacteria bacterium]|nr:Holliday junction branch migration protein RuvA [Candidatus Dojkabacteria bacterium]